MNLFNVTFLAFFLLSCCSVPPRLTSRLSPSSKNTFSPATIPKFSKSSAQLSKFYQLRNQLINQIDDRDSSSDLYSQSQTYCWGNGGAVQYGSSPSQTWPNYHFNVIKVGRIHFCAIEGLVNETIGQAYCWGNSLDGEVGNGQKGDYVDDPSLLMLDAERAAIEAGNNNYPLTKWVEIAVGQDFSCGKSDKEELYCWGGNYWGQLGTGVRYTSTGTPSLVLTSNPSNPSIHFPSFRNISLGAYHGCAIAETDAAIWCWGKAGDGQLGNNSTNSSFPYPVQIFSGNLIVKSFSSVSSGVAHTCAISTDRQVYCWGSNRYGQLGVGGITGSSTPQRVSKVDYEYKTPVELSSSERHTCLLTSDGSVYCWGDAGYGKLGNGQTNGIFYQPQKVLSTIPSKRQVEDHTHDYRSTPTQDGGRGFLPKSTDLRFISIETGQSFSCAQASDGFIYCWGANGAGQLGNGVDETNSSIGYSSPQKVSQLAVSTGQQPFYLSAGDYSSCFITGDKSIVKLPDPSGGQTTVTSTSGPLPTSTSTTTTGTTKTTGTSGTSSHPQGSSSSHLSSSFVSILLVCVLFWL